MSKHDQHQEARTALESGVAAVEKIIRDRDVETQIAQLRLGRLLGLIERDRLVREWFEAFNGDSLGPSEWFKLEVLLESPPQSRDGTSAHDDGCEADWGSEGQESPCRCAEWAQGEPSDARAKVIDALVMTRLSDFAGTDMGVIEQAADAVLAALRAAGVVAQEGESRG